MATGSQWRVMITIVGGCSSKVEIRSPRIISRYLSMTQLGRLDSEGGEEGRESFRRTKADGVDAKLSANAGCLNAHTKLAGSTGFRAPATPFRAPATPFRGPVAS